MYPTPPSAPDRVGRPLSDDKVAVLEHVLNLPDDARRVGLFILEQMADSFTLCAFADAVDEVMEEHAHHGGPRHPFAPKGGDSYDDWLEARARTCGYPEGLREEAEDKAAALYLAILRAPGGYDPAPAILRWTAAGNEVSAHWRREYPRRRDADEAAARCWGHYAVMEALGHGVAWSDDNAPLFGPPRFVVRAAPGGTWIVLDMDAPNTNGEGWDARASEDGKPPEAFDFYDYDDCDKDAARYAAERANENTPRELPAVGDLGLHFDAPMWCDEYTERAYQATHPDEEA